MPNIIKTNIEGLVVLEPEVYCDERGYFFESFSEKALPVRFVQDNESKSSRGVLRGLHYQVQPMAQSKLVRVVSGCILDVAVDIREGSPTFGRHFSIELSGDNKRQLFMPRGFAHGFIALCDDTVVSYKCDNYYSPEHERAIAFDDSALGIDWMLPRGEMCVSAKDIAASPFADVIPFEE